MPMAPSHPCFMTASISPAATRRIGRVSVRFGQRLRPPRSRAHIVRMPKPRRMVVLVVPPIEELDLVGPVQVLSTATRLMRRGGMPYRVEVVSTTRDRLIAGESGLSLVAQGHYRDVEGRIDSLLLVSGVQARNRRDDELAAWLRRTVPACRRVGAVCIAAFILAHAGVLTDQRATVHWKYAHELAHRFPRLSVDPNPIWVQAGNIYTSSGFSAGIDLALAWVAEDCGSAVAVEAARELVLFLRRPAGQTQLSVTLAAQAGEMQPIQELQVLDRGQPRPARPLDRRARRPGLDERPQLRRACSPPTSAPRRPGTCCHLRVEAARRLLQSSSHDLRRIAAAAGFGSADGMRRAFVRVLGRSPRELRARDGDLDYNRLPNAISTARMCACRKERKWAWPSSCSE